MSRLTLASYLLHNKVFSIGSQAVFTNWMSAMFAVSIDDVTARERWILPWDIENYCTARDVKWRDVIGWHTNEVW